MCEIKTADIRAGQNELIKQGYAPTYLKSINNQLAARFNYAVRYYDLKDNPCRKAGSTQKREDRKIKDYFEHVAGINQDMAVEIIFQCGDKKYWHEH